MLKTSQKEPLDFGNEEDVAKVLKELAAQDDVDFDDLLSDVQDGESYGMIRTEDYVIFVNEDAGKDAALNRVREDLKSNPEIFRRDWLLGHIDEERAERFFRQFYSEWDQSYVADIRDDGDRLQEEMDQAGVEDEDALVEYMVQSKIDEGNGGFDYFEDNFGAEDANKLLVNESLLDLEAAAQDAIRVDGWSHFMNSYNGDYATLPSGAVYF